MEGRRSEGTLRSLCACVSVCILCAGVCCTCLYVFGCVLIIPIYVVNRPDVWYGTTGWLYIQLPLLPVCTNIVVQGPIPKVRDLCICPSPIHLYHFPLSSPPSPLSLLPPLSLPPFPSPLFHKTQNSSCSVSQSIFPFYQGDG